MDQMALAGLTVPQGLLSGPENPKLGPVGLGVQLWRLGPVPKLSSLEPQRLVSASGPELVAVLLPPSHDPRLVLVLSVYLIKMYRVGAADANETNKARAPSSEGTRCE